MLSSFLLFIFLNLLILLSFWFTTPFLLAFAGAFDSPVALSVFPVPVPAFAFGVELGVLSGVAFGVAFGEAGVAFGVAFGEAGVAFGEAGVALLLLLLLLALLLLLLLLLSLPSI